MSAPVDPSTDPVPGPPVPYPPSDAGPAPRRRPRWWLVGVVTAWALVLVVLAIVSQRQDRPTAAEQRDVDAAMPAVDRAAGALLAAMGPDPVFAIGPLLVTPDCPVTPVRAGAEVTRDITVYARAGEAPAILDAIGAALPAGYGAEVTHRRGGTVHVLHADAGDFIAVRGTVADGVITLRADAGCRPLDGPVPVPMPSTGTPAVALAEVLSALDLSEPSSATAESVACPGGTTARTVAADGMPPPVDLGTALRPLTAGATVVAADPARYAFRVNGMATVVTVADGWVQVRASTAC